jgi:hypothetical protein
MFFMRIAPVFMCDEPALTARTGSILPGGVGYPNVRSPAGMPKSGKRRSGAELT